VVILLEVAVVFYVRSKIEGFTKKFFEL
jgi:hypothetical protein